MNSKRIFATCMFIALLAVAASAQTNDRGMPWKKYFERNTVVMPLQSPPAEMEIQSDGLQPERAGGNVAASASTQLEGTWLATVTFEDGTVIKVLFTFMPGRNDTQGTLIDTNQFLLTPDPIGTPDQGVWQRIGLGKFIATHLAFLFNSNDGSPFGTAKVRDAITLSNAGDKFTGTQFVEVFDTNGTEVVSVHATMTAVRLKAEAPPAN